MKTLGIDLATQDLDTAACLVEWDARPRVEIFEDRLVSDALIVELANAADVTAIDAPFGWPRPFSDALTRYASGAAWPIERPSGLWLRATDLKAQQWAGGRPPLSVSSDRIARPAERAARLLTILGRDGKAAGRDGSDRIIEVYPAGALRHWGVEVSDYKQRGAVATRDRVARTILNTLRFDWDAGLASALALRDHGIDALAAALVGRAFARGQTTVPEPSEGELASIEGWIHMPTAALGELVDDADVLARLTLQPTAESW